MTTTTARRAPAALLAALALVAGLGASAALAGTTGAGTTRAGGPGHPAGVVGPGGGSTRRASSSGPAGPGSAGCLSWHFHPAVTLGALGHRADRASTEACVVAQPAAGPVRA